MSLALPAGWLLYADEKRKADRMTEERALERLLWMTEEDWTGRKAAVMALDLVDTTNADPCLLAVLLERAWDGAFAPVNRPLPDGAGQMA